MIKPGDKVKIISSESEDNVYWVLEMSELVGDILEVVSVNHVSDYNIYLKCENGVAQEQDADGNDIRGWYFPERVLELVNNKSFFCSRCGGGLVEKNSQGLFGETYKIYKCESCGYCNE